MEDLSIEKILFAPHMLTNYMSINSYLRYVDTVIVSYDITAQEMDDIISKANKDVSFFISIFLQFFFLKVLNFLLNSKGRILKFLLLVFYIYYVISNNTQRMG